MTSKGFREFGKSCRAVEVYFTTVVEVCRTRQAQAATTAAGVLPYEKGNVQLF